MRDMFQRTSRPVPKSRPANRVEIRIGRSLAMSAHPTIAWRILSAPRRTLMVFGYFAASYVAVFVALQLLSVFN